MKITNKLLQHIAMKGKAIKIQFSEIILKMLFNIFNNEKILVKNALFGQKPLQETPTN